MWEEFNIVPYEVIQLRAMVYYPSAVFEVSQMLSIDFLSITLKLDESTTTWYMATYMTNVNVNYLLKLPLSTFDV